MTITAAPPSQVSGLVGHDMAVEPASNFPPEGFVKSGPLLSGAQCALLLSHMKCGNRIDPAGWFKGHAVTDRLIYDIAANPLLLDMLVPLLGENIILWGASVVERSPGRIHPWHVDKESAAPGQRFATAWIGLRNTCRESGLSFIGGSHLFPKTIQEVQDEKRSHRGEADDATVLSWAREMDASAALMQPELRDGEGVLFDGRLWHGSRNRSKGGTRTALLLQYASSDAPVLMLNPDTRDWVRKGTTVLRPPVIVVRGEGNGGGNLVVPPPPTTRPDYPEIVTEIVNFRLPLADDPREGWRPHRGIAGHTRVHDQITCHASVLSPGRMPHPPHSHLEEEILIVLDGRGELLIGDSPDPDAATAHPAAPGTFAYYPAYQHHTLRNTGSGPLTYLMFRWRGSPSDSISVSPVSVIDFGRCGTIEGAKPFKTKLLLEGPTNFLGKLHIHLSEVRPGAGYDPHCDDYDVAIVMLSGTVETIGRTLGPCDVAYYAANEPHGLHASGAEPARYLVVEFHGDSTFGANRAKLKGVISDDTKPLLKWLKMASRNYPALSRRVPKRLKERVKSFLQ